MDPLRYDREPPTFQQTVVIIRTMSPPDREDLEAIKLRHLALGFHYSTDQIHRALRALDRPRPSPPNRRSVRST